MVGITRPITKHNYVVTDIKDLAKTIHEAFYIARTRRPGPVLVDLPSDVLGAKIKSVSAEPAKRRGYQEKPTLNLNQIKKAANLINKSKRPLIYAGGGITLSNSSEKLRALAEKGQLPVTHTLMGVGIMDPHSPLSVGMLGMYGAWYANMAVSECDCLIAIGVRFDDRVTGNVASFAPKAKIIHLDIDPTSIRKVVQGGLPIVCDAAEAMDHLLELIEPKERRNWFEDITSYREKAPLPRPERDHIVPHEVMEALAALAGDRPVVASDVGLSQMWTANYLPFGGPRQYITSGGLGTMGYALPAAMGAAVGNPDRPVIAINGDGAFQMNCQELATCAQYNIPVKCIILNNGKLGMVRQFQRLLLDSRYASTNLGDHVDFCMVSQGFGVKALRVKNASELMSVLKQALEIPGPVVVEVPIHPDTYAFPMVLPGSDATQMVFDAD